MDPDLQHCLEEQRVGIRGLTVLEQLQHVVDRHWSLTRKITTKTHKMLINTLKFRQPFSGKHDLATPSTFLEVCLNTESE